MNRKLAVMSVLLVFLTVACGSMNRVLPSNVDAKAMEADVRSKIAEVVTETVLSLQAVAHQGNWVKASTSTTEPRSTKPPASSPCNS